MSVAIGEGVSIGESSPNAVAVGAGSSIPTEVTGATALGCNASAQAEGSVAVGYGSVATTPNEFSVGSPSQTRTITNVTAGVNPTDAVNVSQLSERIPVSTMVFFAGYAVGTGPVGTNPNAPPPGWLMTDGSAVSRTTYADLFAVIGTTYGSGDGSTTFNLPLQANFVGIGGSPLRTPHYCIKY